VLCADKRHATAGHSNAPPGGGALKQEVNSRRLSHFPPVAATGVRSRTATTDWITRGRIAGFMLESLTVVRILREVVITALIALAIFLPMKATVQGYEVQYSCMLPNIQDGDWIIVGKLAYQMGEPQRGDTIVFDPPEELNSEYPFIKRLIGLPGETIEIRDGYVFVDGVPLEEDYLNARPNYRFGPVVIPEGQYFVLGDNRNSANDSHNGWTVARENFIGKARLSYWPPSRWSIIDHFDYE
jgi:signal peptidase I